MATARLLLNGWRGAPGNTMPQGVQWDPVDEVFVFGQADDVKGQVEQDSVFRIHGKDFVYDKVSGTYREGGHLSSHGVLQVKGELRALFGHRKLGLGHGPVINGSNLNPHFVRLRGTMAGTATCNQKHNLLDMRSGNIHEGYLLDSVLAGKPVKLFRTVLPDSWYKRFQGHLITKVNGEIVVGVHGDQKTKGASEARLYRITSASKWRTLDEIDTTDEGDEAEGLMDYHDRLWTCSRTGNGDDRYFNVSPTVYRTWVTPPKTTPKPAPKPTPTGPAKDPKAAGTWRVVNVNSWLWGRLARNGKLVDEDNWIQRKAGFEITTGHHFTTIGGVKYLVTEAGRHYTLKYLRKVT